MNPSQSYWNGLLLDLYIHLVILLWPLKQVIFDNVDNTHKAMTILTWNDDMTSPKEYCQQSPFLPNCPPPKGPAIHSKKQENKQPINDKTYVKLL